MKRIQNLQLLFLLIFLWSCSSCASILNTSNTDIRIVTNVPTKKILNETILQNGKYSKDTTITVLRSKSPIYITVDDSINSKTITLKPKLSAAYYANVSSIPYVFLGFIIDHFNKKKYTYHNNVFIDINDTSCSYKSYIPLEPKYQNNNIFKVEPLKILGISNPSISLAYERIHNPKWSTQIGLSYLIPRINRLGSISNYNNTYGFRIGIEQRYYYKKSAPQDWYAAVEIEYLNRHYERWLSFIIPTISGIPDNIYSEKIKIHKQFFDVSGKMGYQYIKKNLCIDMFVGFGLRFKYNRYLNHIPRGSIFTTETITGIAYEIAHRPGSQILVDIPLGVRFGWTF